MKEDIEKVADYSTISYEKFRKIVGDFFFSKEKVEPIIPTITVPKQAENTVLPRCIFRPDETDAEFRSRRTAELMEVIPNGSYIIDSGIGRIYTGRGGYIQFQVEMELGCKHYTLTAEE